MIKIIFELDSICINYWIYERFKNIIVQRNRVAISWILWNRKDNASKRSSHEVKAKDIID